MRTYTTNHPCVGDDCRLCGEYPLERPTEHVGLPLLAPADAERFTLSEDEEVVQ